MDDKLHAKIQYTSTCLNSTNLAATLKERGDKINGQNN